MWVPCEFEAGRGEAVYLSTPTDLVVEAVSAAIGVGSRVPVFVWRYRYPAHRVSVFYVCFSLVTGPPKGGDFAGPVSLCN